MPRMTNPSGSNLVYLIHTEGQTDPFRTDFFPADKPYMAPSFLSGRRFISGDAPTTLKTYRPSLFSCAVQAIAFDGPTMICEAIPRDISILPDATIPNAPLLVTCLFSSCPPTSRLFLPHVYATHHPTRDRFRPYQKTVHVLTRPTFRQINARRLGPMRPAISAMLNLETSQCGLVRASSFRQAIATPLTCREQDLPP
jgi:hypothetical protein